MDLLVLLPALCVALAGLAVAVGGRNADEAFLLRQKQPLRLRTVDVEALARSAPEPVAGRRSKGVLADCRAGASEGLRNPWNCRVRYRSGTIARYRVTIRGDGSYTGEHVGGVGVVEGCCLTREP